MVVEPIKNKKDIDKFLIYLKGKNKRDWLLAKFQLNTGLRVSDVIGIKVSDIMTEKMRFKDHFILHEIKTGKEKKIKLNNSIKRAIKLFVKEENLSIESFLFKSRKTSYSGYISSIQAYRILKEAANVVGIKNFGTHSLRKSWGYWTYKASRYNISLIMDMFNHSSKKITLRYIGMDQESKDQLYSLVQF
ncbi:tyrosine-type recombinase/integrase [Clostridium sp. L74]|uniref:tyrosine-type recombinase/integrase n=1 Tax=Clostridium sp. L74 TaxID=1560217 RepID=UPI0006ABD1EE|nr:tyrosine-type recombinase/integrase [Clostridium sp. L74]KOR25397.1 site-specific recombinase XerD [Clostridium sp. L74]